MTVWALALIAWLVVFPALTLAASYVLSALLVRSRRATPAHGAEVIQLDAFRHRRMQSVGAQRAAIRSDHTAPVA